MSYLNISSSESKESNFIELKKKKKKKKWIVNERVNQIYRQKEDCPSRSVKHGRGNIIKAKHFAFSTRLVFVSSLARAREIDSRGGGRAGCKAGRQKMKTICGRYYRVKSSFEPSFSRNRLRSTANRSNFSASRDASAKRTLIREIES